jgi:hypothetical protein
MTIHNNPSILKIYGKYVEGTLYGIEKSLKAVDQKIQLLFLQQQDAFLLLDSYDIKKEAIVKELSQSIYFLYQPVMTNKVDEKGNYIIQLLASKSITKSQSDTY